MKFYAEYKDGSKRVIDHIIRTGDVCHFFIGNERYALVESQVDWDDREMLNLSSGKMAMMSPKSYYKWYKCAGYKAGGPSRWISQTGRNPFNSEAIWEEIYDILRLVGEMDYDVGPYFENKSGQLLDPAFIIQRFSKTV